MAGDENIAAFEAKRGEKMIEVKLRFWTNNISEEEGKVKPKHAWTTGIVRVEGNRSHGIKPGEPQTFNSLLEIGLAVEKALIGAGITLHTAKRMRKYLSSAPPHTLPHSK
jgi:hypothetical protein